VVKNPSEFRGVLPVVVASKPLDKPDDTSIIPPVFAMVKLVAGLGNPGRKYAKTRHNLGFMVVDLLAEREGASFKKRKGDFSQSTIPVGGANRTLLKPSTFMNLSGLAVSYAARFYELSPREILVVCDDISLPLGKIRIRSRGSDGGHKGLRSIVEELGSNDFPRLRIGIGTPENPDYPVEDFVLSKFSRAEEKAISEAIRTAVSAVETIVRDGVEAAQQTYN
jgi:PTH1 family peptidyl-tRNA hydrolase